MLDGIWADVGRLGAAPIPQGMLIASGHPVLQAIGLLSSSLLTVFQPGSTSVGWPLR